MKTFSIYIMFILAKYFSLYFLMCAIHQYEFMAVGKCQLQSSKSLEYSTKWSDKFVHGQINYNFHSFNLVTLSRFVWYNQILHLPFTAAVVVVVVDVVHHGNYHDHRHDYLDNYHGHHHDFHDSC